MLSAKAPVNGLFGTHGHQMIVAVEITRRRRPSFALKDNLSSVAWQLIKIRTALGCERFETIQLADLLKSFGIQLKRRMGGEHTGAATGIFFCMLSMRRAVGAEKNLGLSLVAAASNA